ncbi:MAG: hypothetical protein ACRDQ5_27375 [Sciscionella sp.]
MSEALSDTGGQTGRGPAILRGTVTGLMTTLGGAFHSLPFLITDRNLALIVAGIVVAIELSTIAIIRKRYFAVSLRISVIQVALGGVLITTVGLILGNA